MANITPVKIDDFLDDFQIEIGDQRRPLDETEKMVARSAIQTYLRTLGIETEGPLQVGDPVTWVSSNTRKVGHIVAIVPAGQKPKDVGFPKAGGEGMSRDHVSYVLKGQRHDGKKPIGSAALYWPHVSLIKRLA